MSEFTKYVSITSKQASYLMALMMDGELNPCPSSIYFPEVAESPRCIPVQLAFSSVADRDAFVPPSDRDAVAYSRRYTPPANTGTQRLYVNLKRITVPFTMCWHSDGDEWVVEVSCASPHGATDGFVVLVAKLLGDKPLLFRGTCLSDYDRKLTISIDRRRHHPASNI